MDALRTPDECFEALPDFDVVAHYAQISDGHGGDVRVGHVDEGPADNAPVLLMHGEPSCSFLYRHMIPVLVGAGHRVVAPDLVGFGRSDKPPEQSDYTDAAHVAWMQELLFDRLDLDGITFFGQDWGGLVGLRLVAARPERFDRVAIGNTGLPTGDATPSEAFMNRAGAVRQAVPPLSQRLRPVHQWWRADLSPPGTHGQPHTTIARGGHFPQEDKGAELAAVLNSFIASG